jgi:hypothetical protein
VTALDLKARRAARLEKAGPAPTVTWDDVTFTLPRELPLLFVDAFAANKPGEACRYLFGDRADEFMRLVQPSIEDLGELAEFYGRTLGESSASTGT